MDAPWSPGERTLADTVCVRAEQVLGRQSVRSRDHEDQNRWSAGHAQVRSRIVASTSIVLPQISGSCDPRRRELRERRDHLLSGRPRRDLLRGPKRWRRSAPRFSEFTAPRVAPIVAMSLELVAPGPSSFPNADPSALAVSSACDAGYAIWERIAITTRAASRPSPAVPSSPVIDTLGAPAVSRKRPQVLLAVRRDRRRPIDRDVVVITARGQLPQAEKTGDRRGFLTDALHQIPIRTDEERMMTDSSEARGLNRPARNRSALAFAESLPQRTGHDPDPWRPGAYQQLGWFGLSWRSTLTFPTRNSSTPPRRAGRLTLTSARRPSGDDVAEGAASHEGSRCRQLGG